MYHSQAPADFVLLAVDLAIGPSNHASCCDASLACINNLNKTPLTNQITNAVAAWMDNRGFKPVETEVTVAGGWVADLAGVIVPTRGAAPAARLVQRDTDPSLNMKEGREKR